MKYLVASLFLFYLLWRMYAFVTKIKRRVKFVQEQVYGKTIKKGDLEIRYAPKSSSSPSKSQADEYTDFEEIN